jgi:hypothetical protein
VTATPVACAADNFDAVLGPDAGSTCVPAKTPVPGYTPGPTITPPWTDTQVDNDITLNTTEDVTVTTATATDDVIKVAVTTGGAARFTGTITSGALTADKTWTFPGTGSGTGTVVMTGVAQSIANKTLTSATLTSSTVSGGVDVGTARSATANIINARISADCTSVDSLLPGELCTNNTTERAFIGTYVGPREILLDALSVVGGGDSNAATTRIDQPITIRQANTCTTQTDGLWGELCLDDSSNIWVCAASGGCNAANWSQVNGGLTSASIDTCAEIAAIVTGETGTCGSLVLSADPVLTGNPTSTTAIAAQDSDTTIATTAFVNAEIAADLDTCAEFAAIMAGETGTCGSLVLSADPVLTGNPTSTTAIAAQDSDTTIATTAFVNAEIAADLDTCAEFAAIMAGETGTCGSLVLSAGPTFTGVPLAPTAAAQTNTTQIATTAFVNTEIAADVVTSLDTCAEQRAMSAEVTGTCGNLVFSVSPTLTTPTISSTGFTNAQHAHTGATSGGALIVKTSMSTSRGTIIGAADRYWALTTVETTDAASSAMFAVAGTVKNLYCTASIAPGSAKTHTITMMLAGVAQALTCALTGTSTPTTCSDVANSFAVTAGQTWSMRDQPTSSPATSPTTCAFEFDAST